MTFQNSPHVRPAKVMHVGDHVKMQHVLVIAREGFSVYVMDEGFSVRPFTLFLVSITCKATGADELTQFTADAAWTAL